jgi:hypothetical protein
MLTLLVRPTANHQGAIASIVQKESSRDQHRTMRLQSSAAAIEHAMRHTNVQLNTSAAYGAVDDDVDFDLSGKQQRFMFCLFVCLFVLVCLLLVMGCFVNIDASLDAKGPASDSSTQKAECVCDTLFTALHLDLLSFSWQRVLSPALSKGELDAEAKERERITAMSVWRRVLAGVTNERGVWAPRSSADRDGRETPTSTSSTTGTAPSAPPPSFWRLDETEGPSRERMRCV